MKTYSPTAFLKKPVLWLFLWGILLSLAAVRALCGGFFWERWFLGWLLALANAGAYDTIRRRAVGGGRESFFSWGLGANGLRAFVFFGAVIGMKFWGGEPFRPFAISAMTGYLAGMIWEVSELHGMVRRMGITHPGLRGSSGHPSEEGIAHPGPAERRVHPSQEGMGSGTARSKRILRGVGEA